VGGGGMSGRSLSIRSGKWTVATSQMFSCFTIDYPVALENLMSAERISQGLLLNEVHFPAEQLL
jgi:hypothetical protein